MHGLNDNAERLNNSMKRSAARCSGPILETDGAALLVNQKFDQISARVGASASAIQDAVIAFVKFVEMRPGNNSAEFLNVAFPREVMQLGHMKSPTSIHCQEPLFVFRPAPQRSKEQLEGCKSSRKR
jgi:hypothetical protein